MNSKMHNDTLFKIEKIYTIFNKHNVDLDKMSIKFCEDSLTLAGEIELKNGSKLDIEVINIIVKEICTLEIEINIELSNLGYEDGNIFIKLDLD